MKPYSKNFGLTAQKILDAVLGFKPPWSLAGRAALWWLTTETGPVKQLGLTWHGRDGLGILPRAIHDRLKAAGLDSGALHGDLRWLWLAVGDDKKSACALKLMVDPEAPLLPPQQFRLHDHFIHVESWRDVRRTTLFSFCKEPNPEDAADLYLLLRRENSPQQGLLDAQRRDPGFDPRQLLAIARIHSRDVDLPEQYRADFRRFRNELVSWLMDYLDALESEEV